MIIAFTGIEEISKLKKALAGRFAVLSPVQTEVDLLYEAPLLIIEPLSAGIRFNITDRSATGAGGADDETTTVTCLETDPAEFVAVSV